MSDYYSEKRKMNHEVNQIVQTSKQNKSSLSITKIVYDLTQKYAVSEKAIKTRLELIARVEPDFKIVEDEAFWED